MVIINREAAIAQLNLLGYFSGDHIYVTAFLPKSHPQAKTDAGRKNDRYIAGECRRWQEEGRGIHFVVNGGGHKLADNPLCRALFYEHDDLSKEDSVVLWAGVRLACSNISD